MANVQAGHQEFLDKCIERKFFEKTGVELYDAVLKKCPEALKPAFQRIRDEEKQHEEMLEELIRNYGGNPLEATPSARLTQEESECIVKVVEERDFVDACDGLLAAELVDNAKWEMMITLAGKIGDRDAKKKFKHALKEEADHLAILRSVNLEIAIRKVEGEGMPGPEAPEVATEIAKKAA